MMHNGSHLTELISHPPQPSDQLKTIGLLNMWKSFVDLPMPANFRFCNNNFSK